MAKQFLQTLIVDPDINTHSVAKSLSLGGHSVLDAYNGKEGLSLYHHHSPDIVLLVADLPILDGFELANQIKDAGGERVPVVFLLDNHDEHAMTRCLANGGDDILTKPLVPFSLKAKINALIRMRDNHYTTKQKLQRISEQLSLIQMEYEAAERVLTKITDHGDNLPGNIRYLRSPKYISSGDVLLVAQPDANRQYILLGDFTGHGLAAAIGTVPVCEIFYAMASKGIALGAILREINKRVHERLPADQFLSATAVEVNIRTDRFRIWNAGLPHSLVYRHHQMVQKHASKNVPLGILADQDFKVRMHSYPFGAQERIYLHTDGITENRDRRETELGMRKIVEILNQCTDSDQILPRLSKEIFQFGTGQLQHDDLSLVEIAPFSSAEQLKK